jgi:hypothetical protein
VEILRGGANDPRHPPPLREKIQFFCLLSCPTRLCCEMEKHIDALVAVIGSGFNMEMQISRAVACSMWRRLM